MMKIETNSTDQHHRVIAEVEMSNGHRTTVTGEWTSPNYDETTPAVERNHNFNTWQTPIYRRIGMIPTLENGPIAELAASAEAVGESITRIDYHVEVRTVVSFTQESTTRKFHKRYEPKESSNA